MSDLFKGPDSIFDILSIRWADRVSGRLVRIIYVDEAGTSAREPVAVVSGVIVHGDQQLEDLEQSIEKVFDAHVPAHLRNGFHFHGLEVFNGGKKIKRSEWAFQERLAFFKDFLGLIQKFKIPVALGIAFAGALKPSGELKTKLRAIKVSDATWEHGIAFSSCLERADRFLRVYLDGEESGMVVAEDLSKNKKFLRAMGMAHRKLPALLNKGMLHPTELESALGIEPKPQILTMAKIRDVPHFVEKGGAPVLQLADAAAYAFRRYFAEGSYGFELCEAMLGTQANYLKDPVWRKSRISSNLFCHPTLWPEEMRNERIEMGERLKELNAGRRKKPSI